MEFNTGVMRSTQPGFATEKEALADAGQRAAKLAAERKDNRLPIDSKQRMQNRTLPTPKVLNQLLYEVARRLRTCRGCRQMGLDSFPDHSRRRVAAAVGAAWLSLEPPASGMAAPLRQVQFGQRRRPTPEVFQLLPRRHPARMTSPNGAELNSAPFPSHNMKRTRGRLPIPQHEFGFAPDTFNLFQQTTQDGDPHHPRARPG